MLLPLRADGFAPYGLATRVGLDVVLGLPIAACVAALIAALWMPGSRRAIAWLGLGLGLALGVLGPTRLIPASVRAHEKTARNLKYIERVYEPRVRDGQREPGPSVVLEPL